MLLTPPRPAPHLHILAIPRLEGRQQLQALAVGVNLDVHVGAGGGLRQGAGRSSRVSR